jgi:hypothetical protein
MSILVKEIEAVDVRLDEDNLHVKLSDGRSISTPIAWYPRLYHGSVAERNNWQFIGRGAGIHWPDLDEDISIEGMIQGRPSTENTVSLKKWLSSRGEG